MQRRNWLVEFTGTTNDGHQRHFAVDLNRHAADYMTPGLHDARNPRCCPLCLTQYSALVTVPPSAHDADDFMAREHHFFNSCARVLAVARTDDDLEPLRCLLKDNILRCRTKAWHPYLYKIAKRDVLYLFVASLYSFLACAFKIGPRPLQTGDTFARSRKGIWPTSLGDLLPGDPRASFAAHAFWCHTLISPAALTFVGMVLGVARPVVWPVLLADPQRAMLLKCIVALLNFGCGRMPAEVGPVLPQWSPIEQSRTQGAATQVLGLVRAGPDSQLDDEARFLAGHEKAVYDSINAVFHSGERLAALEEADRLLLSYVSLRIQQQLALPESALHPPVPVYRESWFAPQDMPDACRMMLMLVVARRRLRTCAGPGCAATAANTRQGVGSGGKLQTCARCKLMMYCGRACQQADWKEDRQHAQARSPHKALCPVLCKLLPAGDVSSDTGGFDGLAELTKDDFAVLLLWARTSNLVPQDVYARFI